MRITTKRLDELREAENQLKALERYVLKNRGLLIHDGGYDSRRGYCGGGLAIDKSKTSLARALRQCFGGAE